MSIAIPSTSQVANSLELYNVYINKVSYDTNITEQANKDYLVARFRILNLLNTLPQIHHAFAERSTRNSHKYMIRTLCNQDPTLKQSGMLDPIASEEAIINALELYIDSYHQYVDSLEAGDQVRAMHYFKDLQRQFIEMELTIPCLEKIKREALKQPFSEKEAFILPADRYALQLKSIKFEQSICDRNINIIMERNQRLIKSTTERMSPEPDSIMDYIQLANIGMREAALRFRWYQDVSFATYAIKWIERDIKQGRYNQTGSVKAPVNVTDRVPTIKEAEKRLVNRLYREPTVHEIALETGLSINAIQETKGITTRATLYVENHADYGVHETATDDIVDSISYEKLVNGLLKRLPERSQQVIIHRYGLLGESGKTLIEVSQMLDLTRERVRQLEREALARLRQSSDFAHISDALR